MTKKRIYRRAGLKDAEDIYRISCRTQLENKPSVMAKRGFLLGHYTSNPEIKKEIEADIFDTVFLVCETRKGISGFLQGHLSESWLRMRPGLRAADGGRINWFDEPLQKLGIVDIHNFKSFGVIDRVSVDQSMNQNRVAFDLIKLFGKILLESGKYYIISEIVTQTYREETPLDIANRASINFHKKLGFLRVGRSEKYHYEDTFLKEKGYFRDDIFMAKISALPYKYRRLFRII